MIFTKIKLQERGAVALITSIIISILLTIIVTGLISLMSSELRQSNDSEQSTRAYYAAQSGIEDGIQQILNALPLQVTPKRCDLSSRRAIVSGIPVGWTCQQITYSGTPQGVLPLPDQATQIDLAGAPTFTSLVLSWDKTSSGNYTMPYPLPTSAAWNGAAALEMTFIDYTTTGYLNGQSAQSNIKTQNLLVIPSLNISSSPTLGSLVGNNPYPGHCDPRGAGYHCSITITGFSAISRSYIVRLRSRYQGTSYQMVFYNGPIPVAVPDGTATIDVTARAGDVFRRVIYKVPLNNGAATGLDYVLFSDNNICKDYSIIGGSVQGSYPCPAL